MYSYLRKIPHLFNFLCRRNTYILFLHGNEVSQVKSLSPKNAFYKWKNQSQVKSLSPSSFLIKIIHWFSIFPQQNPRKSLTKNFIFSQQNIIPLKITTPWIVVSRRGRVDHRYFCLYVEFFNGGSLSNFLNGAVYLVSSFRTEFDYKLLQPTTWQLIRPSTYII